MTEAIRSIAEWIASVTIATEPVTAPATSLSRISVAFEPIDSPAARRLRTAAWSCETTVIASSVGQPREQRAYSVSTMADRVLLGVGELGHRAGGWAPGLVVREEGRVVAEPSLAARVGRERALAAALEDLLDALGGVDVSQCADIREPATGRRLTQQFGEVVAVARVRAGVAG